MDVVKEISQRSGAPQRGTPGCWSSCPMIWIPFHLPWCRILTRHMQDVPASASFFWSHTGLGGYRHVFRECVQQYASASRMKKYQSKRKLRFEKSIAQFPNLCTVHMLSHILLQTFIYYNTERVQINFEHSSDINANDFKRHVWGKALAGCAGLKLRNDAHQSVALILHLFMHVSLYIPMSFRMTDSVIRITS